MSSNTEAALAADAPSPNESLAARPRKRRINVACNLCRSRKTRCDGQKPSCMACQAAGIECVTMNLRKPGLSVRRHEAGRPETSTPAPGDAGAAPSSSTKPSRRAKRRRARDLPAWNPAALLSPSETTLVTDRREDDDDTACSQDADPKSDKFQGRLPLFRQTKGETSSEIASDWLHIALHRLGIRRVWSSALPPRVVSVPVELLLQPQPPAALTDTANSQRLASLFFSGPNILFPVLSEGPFVLDVQAAERLGPLAFARRSGVVALLHIYLVKILGHLADPNPRDGFDVGQCLDYCMALLGPLQKTSDVRTVQAMALTSMALRCSDNVVASWHIMSLAASMATSASMSRKSRPRPKNGPDNNMSATPLVPDDEARRVWLCTFALEKMLSFELGRASSIATNDFGDWLVEAYERDASRAALSLAATLGRICGRCVKASNQEEGSLTEQELNVAIYEKVRTTGESVLELMAWAESLPISLRPTAEWLQNRRQQPIALFLSLTYHNALITLARNMLLISEEAIHISVDKIARDQPWDHVVRNGPSIATSASRRILRLVLEAVDAGAVPTLPCFFPPLQAAMTLAIHVLSHPRSRMVGADIRLIEDSADVIRHSRGGVQAGILMDSVLMTIQMSDNEAPVRDAGIGQQSLVANPTPAASGAGAARAAQSWFVRPEAGNADFVGFPATDQQDQNIWMAEWLSDGTPSWHDSLGWDWGDISNMIMGDGVVPSTFPGPMPPP